MFLVTFCVWVCWPSNSGEKGFTIWGPFFWGWKKGQGGSRLGILAGQSIDLTLPFSFWISTLGYWNTSFLSIFQHLDSTDFSEDGSHAFFSPSFPQELTHSNHYSPAMIGDLPESKGRLTNAWKPPKEIRPKTKGRDYVKPPWYRKKRPPFPLGRRSRIRGWSLALRPATL